MATYTDHDRHTTTTVTVYPESHSAAVKVRPIAGYRHWRRPAAATIRKYVDAAIAESAYPSWRRVTRALVVDTDTGWNIFFTLGD